MKHICTLLLVVAALPLSAQRLSKAWVSDLGNGAFRNPVICADYSDPDVIRVGRDYWLTSSSFNCVPGLQILHSTDLVNWQIVGAALPRMYDGVAFDTPQHGNGVWAPSIRYHEGTYYIFWGDPDRGIYVVSARNPRREWSEPRLIYPAKGVIDPSPLWDDDGRLYVVHGWAGSRAGFKSILSVVEFDPHSFRPLTGDVDVFDGHSEHPTIEGPKFYRRGKYYYIFAPAGGVKEGWQLVMRSEKIYGPYEWRKVLHQGSTETHGPHQGGWVTDTRGESWFVHFVDRYAYGRVVHLQPMTWERDGWCTMGADIDKDGVGEPVASCMKPAGRSKITTVSDSDTFDSSKLGLQWQWHANPMPAWIRFAPQQGTITLNCVAQCDEFRNLWDTPNLLLQKFPAERFSFTARLRFVANADGERGGIVVMGEDYATLSFSRYDSKTYLEQTICIDAPKGSEEMSDETIAIENCDWFFLRVTVGDDARCQFSYSTDGKEYKNAGSPFTARAGRWIGAKVGLFAKSSVPFNNSGWVEVDQVVVDGGFRQ